MMAESVIAAGDILMIRRVYCQLRAEGWEDGGEPRRLAANLIYLYRIGVRQENQLLELAPYLT
ncbi:MULTISPECIES: hypothetical protein [Rhizobium]|uniref:Uncharacterized protein n=1 Tax=Rhizobium wenxiniae TaxID=1737357 RepID=A0A7X0CZE7_9HYPH|nr:hypothetical protein [Rhizobium wenxiniae]MBB6162265.1 hypothetical protein [Rhizobium wenxiniae]GGF99941.1 hypothetical protein GCM10010924_30230 [Rhizobium wenxiniae]